MPEPLVSIVISSFNCEKYLSAAIESALAQTYRNIEVVVVDDGSSDGSPSIIKKFGSLIRAIFQTCQGPTAAFNTGLAESAGSIILFFDGNDVLFPAAVRQIMEAWQAGAIKVQYRLELIDNEGKSKGIAFPRYPKNYTPKALCRDFLTTGHYPWPAASGNAYDRGFLVKIMPLSTEAFPLAPEGAINTVAPLFGEIITLPRPLACYRSPGSIQRALTNPLPAHFTNYIQQKEREMAYLRQYAQIMGVALPPGNLLDYSQGCVEYQVCLRKLALDDPGVTRYSLIRLCLLAFRNLLTPGETTLRRMSSMLFCILLAFSKRKLALRLIALRYDPASPPMFSKDILKA